MLLLTAKKTLILTDDDTECVIVKPDNAYHLEEEAAQELQSYIQKIIGIVPEIITDDNPTLTSSLTYDFIPIFIGNTDQAESLGLIDDALSLEDDSYIIKVTPKAVYLVGKDPLGSRFAVSGLLEDYFSVHWYMPGEIGEVVTGNNQENACYPAGLCAERVAIFQAGAKYPSVVIKAIAISATSMNYQVDTPAAPCGNCRQSISEYEVKQKQPIQLLMMGELGEVLKCNSIGDILPLAFTNTFLK